MHEDVRVGFWLLQPVQQRHNSIAGSHQSNGNGYVAAARNLEVNMSKVEVSYFAAELSRLLEDRLIVNFLFFLRDFHQTAVEEINFFVVSAANQAHHNLRQAVLVEVVGYVVE